MTNFEANREMIEKIIREEGHANFGVVDGKPTLCASAGCWHCEIGGSKYWCSERRKMWLNSEAESEEMRFAKTLKEGDIVEVSENDNHWHLRYFKQISECQEKPFVCHVTYNHDSICSWKHIRKAEFNPKEKEQTPARKIINQVGEGKLPPLPPPIAKSKNLGFGLQEFTP